MGISKKLDETLDNLDLDSSSRELKDRVISKSMNNLKEKMSGLDIKIERQEKLVEKGELKPHYEGTELAEVAVQVYRTNINPVDSKEIEKKAPKDQPSTIASRANVRSLSRSLAGMRSSGNEGKVSPVGPNGVGNVGKVSPTGDNGVGNVSGPVGSYYALTTDMTLEEYEKHVNDIFEGDEYEKQEKTKKEIKARGGPPGSPDPSKKVTKEDVVHELEQRLVTLGSTDWIVVDQVLREMARELDVAPRTLSREFKSIHGVFPDKWIKEHLEVEVCGYMPLEEAARLNKVGKVYEVTFMFRGGTNRLKFFWPHPGDASKEDMQREVEKFWPKGRVLAFYPTIDNEMQSNYMVMAPPVTENYKFMQPEDWTELSEEVSELIEVICEEEGEPISPVINEDNGYSMYIEDHDTGEERQVFFNEEGLRDWFGKSSSKDGKSGAAKPTNVKTDVKEEAVCPVCGFDPCQCLEGTIQEGKSKKRAPWNNSFTKTNLENPVGGNRDYAMTQADEKKERRADRKKNKPAHKYDTNEEFIPEEKDKKSKGSGKKDACYSKVKSRYSVWPSAYASGALVKCRQKGAANWGNSSKKEEVEYVDESESVKFNDGLESKVTRVRGDFKKPKPLNALPKNPRGNGLDKLKKKRDSINKFTDAESRNLSRKEQKEEVEQLDELSGKFLRDASSKANEERRKAHRDGDSARADDKQAQSKRLFHAAQDKKRKEMNEDEMLEDMKDFMTEGGIKSGHKRPTDQGAGLTQKGVDAENAKTGGNLQTAVTTPPSKLKPGSKAAGRRKSFCARSRSWDGERGKAARRRWNC